MENGRKLTRREALATLAGALGAGLSAKLLYESSTLNYTPIQKKPKIIAHKRNTPEGIEQAIQKESDIAEFDLRRTRDGVYVAYHDPEFNKTPISELTYNQLKGVPKLEDLLQKYGNQCKWMIHLKEQGDEQGLVEFLDSHLQSSQSQENPYIITSEHLESLKKIKKTNPNTPLGLILLKGKFHYKVPLGKFQAKFAPYQLIKDAVENNFDFIVPDQRYLSTKLLQEAEKYGIQVYPWTVNSPEEIEKLREMGVRGIITDYPELIK